MIKIKRIGYDKSIVSKSNWNKKVDKAFCCPDCNTMTGNAKRVGENFISTCSRCGLIWETK